MTRDEIRGLGAVLMDGGVETSSTYLQTFIIALLQSPESQLKAQKEIDSVVGGDRLPVMEDFKRLPYVKALVMEIFRYRPIFPVGLPHVTTEDLTYQGYHIPKDSFIFMNIWGMYHHPDYFDEPEIFKPERYLNNQHGTKEGVNTTGFRDNLPFGAGRRICPGEGMAMRTIMLNTMNLLWAFNFVKDESGTGSWDIDSYPARGAELAPPPFTCTITPRDEKRANLIKQMFEDNASAESL
jgi:cytochrome P450